MAFRADQHGAVVKYLAVALGDPRHDVDAEAVGGLGPEDRGFTGGYWLGQAEGLLAGVEHVAGVGKFWQHDEVRSGRSRAFDQLQSARNIGRLLADYGLHLDAGNSNLAFRHQKSLHRALNAKNPRLHNARTENRHDMHKSGANSPYFTRQRCRMTPN